MSSYAEAFETTEITLTGDSDVDSILGNLMWGSGQGTAVSVTYSFPWVGAESAWFHDPLGENYGNRDEVDSEFYYELGSAEIAAAEAALSAWSNVANIEFRRVSDNENEVGVIRFAYTSSVLGEDSWGWAYRPNSYYPSGGDIWIHTHIDNEGSSWSPSSYNFKALIHEIGHAIGLTHSFEGENVLDSDKDLTVNTVMSYTAPDESYYVKFNNDTGWYYTESVHCSTPMMIDIKAAQLMYGANYDFNSGDDTYTFSNSTPFYQTIWDGAGVDTVDISNFNTNCVLDLRPGYFSSLNFELYDSRLNEEETYSGKNNLAIAYDCEIENILGGAGNDLLKGNSLDNEISGGSGDDVIYGNEGNDTFDWDVNSRFGSDIFYGGLGDDSYVIDSAGDRVIEYEDEGTDLVFSAIDYSIEYNENIEWIFIFGDRDSNIVCNDSDNMTRLSTGKDTVDGKLGIDTCVVLGAFADYSWTVLNNSINLSGPEIGVNSLENIERIKFEDKSWAFDIEGSNSSGGIYRTYQAAFNREPDHSGFGYWIDRADNNASAVQMAEEFVWSREFQEVYGVTVIDNFLSGSDVELVVEGFYRNVLGRSPDQGGLDYYSNVIVDREKTAGRVLAEIADSSENRNLVYGDIQNGMIYDLWIG